jgi:hypothetical protein
MACVYLLHLSSSPEDIRYVGMTKYNSAERRFQGHIDKTRKTKKSRLPVYDWMRKYEGQVSFTTFKSGISVEEAQRLERSLITQYRSTGRLLNCNDGGEGAFNPTPKTRRKISEAKKGKPPHPNASSPEARAKISAALKGRTFSDETRKKMSESARKKPKISEETRQKYKQASTGRFHSDEAKAKMREVALQRPPMSEEARRKISESRKGKPSWNKGKTMTDEMRKKLSNSRKGRKLSEEHRKKISDGGKRRHASS